MLLVPGAPVPAGPVCCPAAYLLPGGADYSNSGYHTDALRSRVAFRLPGSGPADEHTISGHSVSRARRRPYPSHPVGPAFVLASSSYFTPKGVSVVVGVLRHVTLLQVSGVHGLHP